MAVYRFRVSVEDNEDICRDIDIKSGQTFDLFHECIQDAFKFDKKHAASFFVSDDYWRKNQEITLRKEDLAADEEDLRKKRDPKKLMADTKIASLIEQPHQRFVYVFDPNVQWTFLVEMIKILADDPKMTYPVCVRTQGTAPKQYKHTHLTKGETSPDMAMASLLAEPEAEPEEEEVYKAVVETEEHGVDDEDLKSMEGEEGEEEENNEESDNEFGEEGEESEDYGFGKEDEDRY